VSDSAPSSTRSAGLLVRRASQEDVAEIATAVAELLLELGAKPSSPSELQAAARALVDDETAGVLLIAGADAGQIVGLLGVSWQLAVRIPGRYGLIQELWVHPSWRSRAIGGQLLSALDDIARELGVARIEVGLPSERFAHLAGTQAFYRAHDFTAIGTRMRRLL
jgi:GNAT superfamily N-acetyltransferase